VSDWPAGSTSSGSTYDVYIIHQRQVSLLHAVKVPNVLVSIISPYVAVADRVEIAAGESGLR
jgi:hypothetical protein